METSETKLGHDSLNIIPRKAWPILLLIFVMAIDFVIWLFLGVLSTKIEAEGFINTRGNAIEIHQEQTGLVTEICVEPNVYVAKGQLLAKIYPWDGIASLPSMDTMKENSSDILSPTSGYVTTIHVSEWDLVNITNDLLTMLDDKGEGLSYVFALVGNSYVSMLELGMKADVSIQGKNSEDFGNLKGEIVSISDTYMTPDAISKMTGVVNPLQSEGVTSQATYSVLIRLETGEHGRVLLDNGEEASTNLRINTLCDVTITVDEMHPYEKLF